MPIELAGYDPTLANLLKAADSYEVAWTERLAHLDGVEGPDLERALRFRGGEFCGRWCAQTASRLYSVLQSARPSESPCEFLTTRIEFSANGQVFGSVLISGGGECAVFEGRTFTLGTSINEMIWEQPIPKW